MIKASCDCCGKVRKLYVVNPELACGIDTAACADCLNIPVEDRDEDDEESEV